MSDTLQIPISWVDGRFLVCASLSSSPHPIKPTTRERRQLPRALYPGTRYWQAVSFSAKRIIRSCVEIRMVGLPSLLRSCRRLLRTLGPGCQENVPVPRGSARLCSWCPAQSTSGDCNFLTSISRRTLPRTFLACMTETGIKLQDFLAARCATEVRVASRTGALRAS